MLVNTLTDDGHGLIQLLGGDVTGTFNLGRQNHLGAAFKVKAELWCP